VGFMAAPIDSRKRAKDLVEQLPQEVLSRAIAFLESLCQGIPPIDSSTSDRAKETALLQVIQRRLPPAAQARLNDLRQRNTAETITPAEHQEPYRGVRLNI
jgi:hypothetical protein